MAVKIVYFISFSSRFLFTFFRSLMLAKAYGIAQLSSNLPSGVPISFFSGGKERLIQLLDYSSAAP